MNHSGPTTEPQREQLLSDARRRLVAIEAEAHRLRAQLAQLEAAGEQAEAERLEAELARLDAEQQTARDRVDIASPAGEAPSDASPRESASTIEGLSGIAPQPPTRPTKRRSAKRRTARRANSDPKQSASDAPVERPRLETSADDEHRDQKKRSSLAARLRDAPALATSLGVHVAILVLLSLWTFVTLQETPPVLLGSAPDGEELLEELVEVDFTATELDPTELDLQEFELEPTEVTEFEPTEIEEPWDSAAVGLTDLSPGLAASLPTDSASLLLGESGGEATGGRSAGERPGGGKPGSARFFGARSKGNRFVFVVDNSGTMKQGRMETTLIELQRAIGAMKPEQHFYVIFFSDQAYPMFFPESVDEMAPATRDNKRRLAAWFQTVEICNGGQMIDAMKMAATFNPGVVYLLSDGDMGAGTRNYMTADNGWNFIVHTLGMTVRNAEDAGNLIAIAEANGGGFTPVGINPLAAEMAKQRPIHQHRTPGLVWGSKVRAR